ncbi:MAG: menaquinone biosynthesis protein [Acidobacteriia bacterium]|nr:menaquinone biosynthesis protein [Terriglobia bacterium]
MAKLRISIVQYLNTAPLVRGFTHGPLRGKYDLSFTVPSQCAEALRSGAADIAIIPAIEYQRIEDLVVLPDLAIAAQQEVRSLLVIAKKPIAQARRIALDRSSRSTQALVKILCAKHWKIAPEFTEAAPDPGAMLREADAALLIGDPALRLALQIEGAAERQPDGSVRCPAQAAGIGEGREPRWNRGELFVYDIVQQWRSMTGLPAVLAFWAGRRAAVTPEVAADFQASREYGVARIAEIAAEAADELHMPADELDHYLRENIDFTLGEENRRGLALYYDYAAELGLIPRAKPVSWAAAWIRV